MWPSGRPTISVSNAEIQCNCSRIQTNDNFLVDRSKNRLKWDVKIFFFYLTISFKFHFYFTCEVLVAPVTTSSHIQWIFGKTDPLFVVSALCRQFTPLVMHEIMFWYVYVKHYCLKMNGPWWSGCPIVGVPCLSILSLKSWIFNYFCELLQKLKIFQHAPHSLKPCTALVHNGTFF